MKSKIVFLGGIECGKSSTIKMLWDDDAITAITEDQDIVTHSIREFVIGREYVEYDVVELPRVAYSSNSWSLNPYYKLALSEADLIVYMMPINDYSYNLRVGFLMSIFEEITLKDNVSIIVTLSKADIILTPKAYRQSRVSSSRKVGLDAVSKIISKHGLIYDDFQVLSKYDKKFSINNIIPFSNALYWNLDNLKYAIWNFLTLSENARIYDPNLPTVILSGKTGCGKTSTINRLWNKQLAVERAVSCTKFPVVMHISDVVDDEIVEFNLIDLPGIAESLDANALYRGFYYHYIKKADVLICLSQADRRAYKQDELFYKELINNSIISQSTQVILGVNQADLLFKDSEHLNGVDLQTIDDEHPLIKEKIHDLYDGIYKKLFNAFDTVSEDSVVVYSILNDWNTNKLKQKIYSLIR